MCEYGERLEDGFDLIDCEDPQDVEIDWEFNFRIILVPEVHIDDEVKARYEVEPWLRDIVDNWEDF